MTVHNLKSKNYSLIRRVYDKELEQDKYYLIDTVKTSRAAESLAEKTLGDPEDILIVCDTAYVSDLPKYAKTIYGFRSNSAPIRIPVVTDRKLNSINLWEGQHAAPDSMMEVAMWFLVNYTLIDSCVIDIAEDQLCYMPSNKDLLNLVNDTMLYVREVAAGNYSNINELKRLTKIVDTTYGYDSQEQDAIGCISCCSNAILQNFKSDYIGTVQYVMDIHRCSTECANDLCSVIRKYIPLRVLLSAYANK